MSANFSEILEGPLARGTGAGERFACTLQLEASGSSTLAVVGGTVEWADPAVRGVVTEGEIELFRPPPNPGEAMSTGYRFGFTVDGVGYILRGEKRFATASAAADLSAVFAEIAGPGGSVASGVLTCQLDHLLREYEGALADGPHIRADISDARRHLHDLWNRTLAAIYPHLPTLLAPGRGISDGLRRTLRLLAEVLLPTPLPANGPTVDDVVAGIDGFLEAASGKQVQTIRTLLQVISLFVPVLQLEIGEIRAVVARTLADEHDSLLRQSLSGIHQIVAFAYYADRKADALLGYNRPVHRPEHRTALPVSPSIPDRVFDVVIAGTGPAGSLLADRLTAKGLSVLLLEGGKYIPEQEITPDELNSIARLYKMSGLQASRKPSSITVLQGACVGGGGVINNGIFFPLAAATLDEWRAAGFPFDVAAMSGAYGVVASELNIGDVQGKARRLNPSANYLRSLGEPQAPPMGPAPPGFYRMALNLETLPAEGEATGCRSTGLCNLGCGSERKVNSFQYYLKNALTTGRDAVLVPEASVQAAVMGSGGARRTVTALQVKMADGSTALARGKQFLLCCGPVGSSGVLLRSGDLLSAAGGHLPVGERFCGNVASPAFATAPDAVNRETYVQMCHVFVPELGDDGFLIETWFTPPGGLALAMPGFLKTHENRMNRFQQVMSASPVIGTQAIGRITLSGDDTAIDLPLAQVDLDRLRRGMKKLVTAFVETASPVVVRLGNGREVSTMSHVEALDAEMAALTPKDLHLLPLSTAHPQGGNAISEDDVIGVVDQDFRVRGIANLRVCDGSIFPMVAGVNPQWTIYALAHLCAAQFERGA